MRLFSSRSAACLALACWMITACQWQARRTMDEWLDAPEFERSEITGSGFVHTSLRRVSTDPSLNQRLQPIVYFEGDGRPWNASGTSPNANPDPSRPLTIELAASQEDRAYVLGRPCYFGHSRDAGCNATLWTSGRYSDVVVRSMSAATQRMLSRDGVNSAVLIGYSGGGSLALLVAQHVPQVKAVVTVAANLDLDSWTRYHGYLPLTGSLDPLAAAPLKPGCEIHIAAERDSVVPVEQLRNALTRRPGALLWIEPGIDHACCWTRRWPELLARIRKQLDAARCLVS